VDQERRFMQRALRAKLPNGLTVAVTPCFESERQQRAGLAATAEHLAEMLDSEATQEPDLLHFLANVAAVVFPEADPNCKPSIMHGSIDYGADLTFGVKATPGIGVVEIKTSRLNTNRNLQASLERLPVFPRCTAFGLPVHVAYLVAGRGRQLHTTTLRQVAAQSERIGVPLNLLSWDQIVDRLSEESDEKNEPKFEVVLIEVVKLSRGLLRAILRQPAVLYGIDDRKFEELVATLLFDLGVQEVNLTPPRKDGGRDIVAVHLDPASGDSHTYLIECKHWVSGTKVTMRWALSLLDVAKSERATGAVLLSSSGFGPKLLEQETRLMQQGLFLKNQSDLLGWINLWERQYGSILLEPVDPRIALQLNG
jgi:hypothetical protein